MDARHGRRVVRHFLTSLFVGAFAGYVGIADWDFSRHAKCGTARLLSDGTHYRSGATLADAIHGVDGVAVKATLRVWYRSLRAGEFVKVCYRADNPEELTLDGFWQRHFATVIALSIFAIVVAAESMRYAEAKRQNH